MEETDGEMLACPEKPAGALPRLWRFLAIQAVLLAAIVPYIRVLDAPFVFDDVKLVKENRFLRPGALDARAVVRLFNVTSHRWDKEELRPNYRPLRFLSYLADYRLSKLFARDFPPDNPPVLFFHLTNIILHALNALLVYLIVRRLLATAGARAGAALAGALGAGLLFALHPLQTEAVTYISGRRDVLSTFFFLAALVLYLRRGAGQPPSWAAVAGVPLLLAAGLLSKEMVITLPAVLVLLDLARGARWNLRRAGVYILTGAVAVLFAWHTLTQGGLVQNTAGRDPAGVVGTAARYLTRYVGLALFPYPQSVDYSFDAIPVSTSLSAPWTTAPALILTAVLVAAGVVLLVRRKSPGRALAGCGILWFAGTLVPVLQFVPSAESFAERFAYLPLAGAALLFGLVLARAFRAEPLFAAGVAGVACLLALAATLGRNAEWESPLALWTSAVQAQPRAARAHLGRANALKASGKPREAIEEYTQSLEIFEERPDVPLHHGFILQALAQRGSLEGLLGQDDPAARRRAVRDYRRLLAEVDTDGTAIESSPKHTVLHFDLAGILLRQNQLADARREYERVLQIGSPPTLVGAAHYYLAKIDLLEKSPADAIEQMRRAYEGISPSDRVRYQVAVELVDICINRKDYEAAWDFCSHALDDGASGEERLHLLYRQAKILDRRGKLEGCIEILHGILDRDATYGPALITLGEIEANLEHYDEAAKHYRAVPPTSPSFDRAQQELRDLQLRRKLAEKRKDEPRPPGPEYQKVLLALEKKGLKHVAHEEWIAARETFVNLLMRSQAAGKKMLQLRSLKELAGIEERFGRYREAKVYLEKALELAPEDPEALRRMGDLQLRRFQDHHLALQFYRRYLDEVEGVRKADPMVYFNVAGLVSRENPAGAVRYYERALEEGASPALVNRSLGYLHAGQGEWRKALEAFNRYLETSPSGDEKARDAARKFVKETVLPRLLEK